MNGVVKCALLIGALWGSTGTALAGYGGQCLLFLVSDANLGSKSEALQRVPIESRPAFYGYDRVKTISGKIEVGAIGAAAQKLYDDCRVVDVVIFTHGSSGHFTFRDGRDSYWMSAKTMAEALKPLGDKFRMFYTTACEFGSSVNELVQVAGAKVAVGHVGMHYLPLTFPLKFLKYFKRYDQSARSAAQDAFDYAVNDTNPVMSVYYTRDRLLSSKPILSGWPDLTGRDFDMEAVAVRKAPEFETVLTSWGLDSPLWPWWWADPNYRK